MRNSQISSLKEYGIDLVESPGNNHLIASREFKAGSVVLIASPYESISLVNQWRLQCSTCFQVGDSSSLLRCSACKEVYYCTKSCQKV